jgi:hypothetical protein
MRLNAVDRRFSTHPQALKRLHGLTQGVKQKYRVLNCTEK